MKKNVAIALVVALCLVCSVCAQAEFAAAQDTQIPADFQRDSYGRLNLTREQALPYVTRVTLTMDNWQDYFANHTESYHYETVNDFGDATYSAELTYHYFGVADYDLVYYRDVAFKFSSYTDFYSDGEDENGVTLYERWDRVINEDGTARIARYDEGTEPAEEDWSEIDPPEAGYYTATSFFRNDSKHYEGCTGVIGEIILFDFPDEWWLQEDDRQTISINGHTLYRDQHSTSPSTSLLSYLFGDLASTTEEKKIVLPDAPEEIQRDSGGRLNLTREQALPYVKRVTLTLDNWQDYFANHTEPYHYETRNVFGDVTYSSELTYHYFGVADYDLVYYRDVAFKFSSYTDFYSDGEDENGVTLYERWERVIHEDGTARMARYDEGTEPAEEDWSEIDPPEAGYYTATSFFRNDSKHYDGCTGVIGEIILFDFPDEWWLQEDDRQTIAINGNILYRDQHSTSPSTSLLSYLFGDLSSAAEEKKIVLPKAPEEIQRDSSGRLNLTRSQALPYVKRVTLTMDNWHFYFDNHTEPYHYETRNDFGDITYSSELKYHYFGVTGYDLVYYRDVAFKFSSCTDFYSDGEDENGVTLYERWERVINEDGTAKMARYDEGTGLTEDDWDEIDPPEAGYYTATSFYRNDSKHYAGCTDVAGELILFDFPDEWWMQEDDRLTISINGHTLYRDQHSTSPSSSLISYLFD